MRLVIAEKPSVAQSLSAVLGATTRKDGYLEGNGWRVSWCVGHLAGLADADAYNPDYAKWRYDDLPILPMDELVMRYYLRFSVTDRPGVLETMAGVFARHNISVKSIVQRGRSGAERVDQVVVTHRCRERDIREALEEALALDNVVLDTPSVIRVEE